MAMDKFILVSVLLLVIVEILCVTSVFTTNWIVSDSMGGTRHGLYLFCHTFGDEEVCHFQSQHMAWTISSLLIILAIGVMAIGVSLLVINLKRDLQTFASVGKWVALCGLMLLCVVGVVFPLGFSGGVFGGSAYLLNPNFRVGYSYVLFNVAIALGMVAMMIANRMFWPFFAQFFSGTI